MRNFIYIFGLFLGLNICLAGEYANDFLRIGVGARPLAMGGAYVALANDASAFYWNPAGLTQADRISIHFDHVPMFGGIAQYNAANVTMGFDNSYAFGLSWIRLGVDDIPSYAPLLGSRADRLTRGLYRSTGEATGYFGDMQDAVFASFSRTLYFDWYIGTGFSDNKIPVELSFGVTGKYIHHKLDDKKGTGQGLDAGVLLRMTGDKTIAGESKKWLGFGLYSRDLSRTNMVWNTESNHNDQVDMTIQSGVACSYLLEKAATRLTMSYDKEFGFYDDHHVGGELTFFHSFSLRGGYYDEHYSVGAGILLMGLAFDYAFVTKELENTHRVSAAFKF
jgi:hypothetical protein